MGESGLFNGFSRNGITFLQALIHNNNRDWFRNNKDIFWKELETPAKLFLQEMAIRLGEVANESIYGKLFRIYRDIRFSKDKTPYNTHMRILFTSKNSGKQCSFPSFYFSLESDQLILGLGVFEFPRELLSRYQQFVDSDKTGIELDNMMNALTAQGFYTETPEYKRVPRDYRSDHQRADLLRKKGIVLWKKISPLPNEIFMQTSADFCLEYYKSMLPLYKWLYQLY